MCKYSFVVCEFLIILKAQLCCFQKPITQSTSLKSNAKTRTNIHHDDDDDETRGGRGCHACGATSDGDVHHRASSFFFFSFFVVVFDDDSPSPYSGEYKRQVEHGIPVVVIEKRNNAKGKRREDKRRALRGGRRDERARDGVFSSSVLGARCNDKLF